MYSTWIACSKYLNFRQDSIEEYVGQITAAAPWYLKIGLARMVMHRFIRFLMKKVARRPEGPLRWIEDDNRKKIEAFFGSREAWEQIPDWSEPIPEPREARPLSHGYDDSLPDEAIGLSQAQSAAEFRGGECLTETLDPDDLFAPVRWRCAFDHEFTASAYLFLRAGHWCTECSSPPWNYDEIAAVNPFFAQVWPVR